MVLNLAMLLGLYAAVRFGAQGATAGIYNYPSFMLDRYVTAQTQGIAFNTRRPPYDDIRVRSALRRLYNRELRNDASLRGQMVLRLTIEPDGSVSMCKLQSTDMNAPALAEQIVERVKGFAFGAKDVAAVTIVYPIDFLPAA